MGGNVPIPVPLPFFSFTGWGGSFLAIGTPTEGSPRFYTEIKTITNNWFDDTPVTGELPGYPIALK